jgi:hypothetical protein
MIAMAEQRFPVRIRLGVPPGGFGQRHTDITAWLDENCGADGWAMTPSGVRGVLNDAVSIYFLDATLASAFVARWCAGSRTEADGGVYRIRDDEPALRIGASLHRTP